MDIFANVPITALYAGFNALIALALAGLVVRARGKYKVGLGDGGDKDMQAAIRAHSNNAEYVPLALLLLLILEISGAWALPLHLAGSALTIGRILHGWGLSTSSGSSHGRYWGTVLTWLVILGEAVGCIVLSLS